MRCPGASTGELHRVCPGLQGQPESAHEAIYRQTGVERGARQIEGSCERLEGLFQRRGRGDGVQSPCRLEEALGRVQLLLQPRGEVRKDVDIEQHIVAHPSNEINGGHRLAELPAREVAQRQGHRDRQSGHAGWEANIAAPRVVTIVAVAIVVIVAALLRTLAARGPLDCHLVTAKVVDDGEPGLGPHAQVMLPQASHRLVQDALAAAAGDEGEGVVIKHPLERLQAHVHVQVAPRPRQTRVRLRLLYLPLLARDHPPVRPRHLDLIVLDLLVEHVLALRTADVADVVPRVRLRVALALADDTEHCGAQSGRRWSG